MHSFTSGRFEAMFRARVSALSTLVLAWLALFAVAASAQTGNADAKKLKNPVKPSVDSVAAGEKVYAKYCKFCHGADAKGNGPLAPKDTHPPDLTDAKWDHGSTDGEIFTSIRDGI